MKPIKPILMLLALTALFSTAKADNSKWNKGNHYGEYKNHTNEGQRVPIDGGITLLLAAGIGYGVKKVSARNKKTV